jgi:hypothetical protein
MAVDVGRVKAAGAHGFEPESSMSAAERVQAPALSVTRPATYLFWIVILGIAVGFNEVALEQLRGGQASFIGSENGPLEDAQLLLMVPAAVLFGWAWWKGLGAVRVAGALLALMGTIAMVREIDFKSLTGSSAWFDWLVAHELQDGLLALFGAVTALYFFMHRQYFWGLVRLGLRWQAWPCVLSVALLGTAELYLDGIEGPTGHFWEELVETNGYFLFAIAAWMHVGLIGDPRLDQPI